MNIIHKEGDFLEGSETFLLHGCNAMGVMGSGAALAVRKKYPNAYESYIEAHKWSPLQLGEIIPCFAEEGRIIIHAITQQNYGRDKQTVYADYEAIKKAIKSTDEFLLKHWPKQCYWVAMPKIGAGLANGDWEVISKIIEENSLHFQPVVYIM